MLAVLVEDMGHPDKTDPKADFVPTLAWGIIGADLQGSTAPLTWRIQGDLGGENLLDPARGPMNTGGLYGERGGWSLPGYPDGSWHPVSLPDSWASRGVAPGVGWYRTTFSLHLAAHTDVPIGLDIADKTHRH